jgi:LmbE family N-acetylglucosaminyl deacetylase
VIARRPWLAAALAAVLFTRTPPVNADGPPSLLPAEADSAVALGLALRRLPVMGTVLCITAHPDDENNAALVTLRDVLGLRTVVLTATRGEGGQNEIGPELGETLGLLRVAELEAVHRWDGAEQRFARAYDFGYSFSVEETYEKWGRAEILDDFVRMIRAVRPDVILTLPREAKGGGVHHQAAARLAVEAFRAAADAQAYPPEKHGGYAPWQPRKIYESAVGIVDAWPTGTILLRTDEPDPLLGMSPFALGAIARVEHRTQGMTVPLGTATDRRFTLVDSEPRVTEVEAGLLDGVDLSWRRLLTFAGARERPALETGLPPVMEAIAAASAAFDLQAPEKTLPPLRSALLALRRLREEALVADWDPGVRLEILARLQAKETDLVEALALAHGLRFDAVADDAVVVPGQALVVQARVSSTDSAVAQDVVLHVPPGWTFDRVRGAEREWTVRVPATATPTRPFGRRRATAARYDMDERERTGAVFPPPDVTASLRFTSGGLLLSLDRPVVAAVAAAAPPRQVAIQPLFSVEATPEFLVVPESNHRRGAIDVRVRYNGRVPRSAICRVRVPYGWAAVPKSVTLRFSHEDETRALRFRLTAPRSPEQTSGCAPLDVAVVAAGRRYAEGFQELRYPHVATRFRSHPAQVCASLVDARVPAEAQVGYVAGAGDGMLEALKQLGIAATPLTRDDVAIGDLKRFTTIVIGVRAYQTRPELKEFHERLMEYVRGGGHLVLQSNRPSDWNAPAGGGAAVTSPFAPYPAVVSVRRLTDETAPVSLLAPEHPLLASPNRITAADFDGWIQDRGVYLFDARDERYEELLASADPWPLNAGEQKGLLVSARLGNGRWTYVGLALWRQLQAGVPGAYRLLANLVGQPRAAAGGANP